MPTFRPHEPDTRRIKLKLADRLYQEGDGAIA